MTERKIGIYGGTFDPIHYGHLILAREALEVLGLEKVVFIPAAGSPDKPERRLAPPDVRFEMLRAAIENEPGLDLNEIELRRPSPSYTVKTIEILKTRTPGVDFVYLIGEDNIPRLPSWHRFDDLQKMVEFVVLDRTAVKTEHPYTTIRRHVDISATDIRNRVASGYSIRYLVPPAVEKIIRDRRLYRESER